ncbi:hypothetical protein [Mycolicibacterium agri]|uniref:Uncharacterized protein n=1 Tax=Mycolicibacterium agri TaxID=36811 RepID=A0A7I9W520_MYCAG|nr:hypothetical protein [Mycolicibacterium agri]GFG52286.1 hypothetical protein MAGR_37270 [Mycolicibacterium agri]
MGLTLSQVRCWDSEYLTEAALHWSRTADRWNDAFTQIERLTHSPGGTPWEGAAASAAQDRAHADRSRVRVVADELYNASSIARAAAEELWAARQRVLAVVAAAEAAGFTVGEDFSLTTYRAGAHEIAAAEAEARELGRQLRDHIEELLELDQQVAGRITSAAEGVGTLTFTDSAESDHEHDGAIYAVDNRILKDGPPQPPPPDPTPGRMPPVESAEDVRRVLDPLPNGGKRGTNGVGTSSRVKEIWDEGSTRRLWDYLTRNAADEAPPQDYEGPVRVLPDGTRIGFRQSDKWGDTIDVWYPNDYTKTHTPYEPYFPPIIGDPPQLPPPTGIPSVQVLPPQLTHPPAALPPTGIFEPNGLPPWLQDPSTPLVHPPIQAPTILPGVSLPDVPDPPPSASDDTWRRPEVGEGLLDAGQAVGGVIVGGVAVIGGLLGTVANPRGAITP